jgi:hypothetical protein
VDGDRAGEHIDCKNTPRRWAMNKKDIRSKVGNQTGDGMFPVSTMSSRSGG